MIKKNNPPFPTIGEREEESDGYDKSKRPSMRKGRAIDMTNSVDERETGDSVLPDKPPDFTKSLERRAETPGPFGTQETSREVLNKHLTAGKARDLRKNSSHQIRSSFDPSRQKQSKRAAFIGNSEALKGNMASMVEFEDIQIIRGRRFNAPQSKNYVDRGSHLTGSKPKVQRKPSEEVLDNCKRFGKRRMNEVHSKKNAGIDGTLHPSKRWSFFDREATLDRTRSEAKDGARMAALEATLKRTRSESKNGAKKAAREATLDRARTESKKGARKAARETTLDRTRSEAKDGAKKVTFEDKIKWPFSLFTHREKAKFHKIKQGIIEIDSKLLTADHCKCLTKRKCSKTKFKKKEDNQATSLKAVFFHLLSRKKKATSPVGQDYDKHSSEQGDSWQKDLRKSSSTATKHSREELSDKGMFNFHKQNKNGKAPLNKKSHNHFYDKLLKRGSEEKAQDAFLEVFRDDLSPGGSEDRSSAHNLQKSADGRKKIAKLTMRKNPTHQASSSKLDEYPGLETPRGLLGAPIMSSLERMRVKQPRDAVPNDSSTTTGSTNLSEAEILNKISFEEPEMTSGEALRNTSEKNYLSKREKGGLNNSPPRKEAAGMRHVVKRVQSTEYPNIGQTTLAMVPKLKEMGNPAALETNPPEDIVKNDIQQDSRSFAISDIHTNLQDHSYSDSSDQHMHHPKISEDAEDTVETQKKHVSQTKSAPEGVPGNEMEQEQTKEAKTNNCKASGLDKAKIKNGIDKKSNRNESDELVKQGLNLNSNRESSDTFESGSDVQRGPKDDVDEFRRQMGKPGDKYNLYLSNKPAMEADDDNEWDDEGSNYSEKKNENDSEVFSGDQEILRDNHGKNESYYNKKTNVRKTSDDENEGTPEGRVSPKVMSEEVSGDGYSYNE